MRRLCLGGSFNPVHHGHLICARAVAEAAGFDRVVLIPSGLPPHKPAAPDLVAAEHRLEMCRLAAACQSDLFEVSDVEIVRPGQSYTIDTVRLLKSQGWPQVHWLIGADMLQILPQWHQAEALLREASLVIMARPGWKIDFDALPAPFRELRHNVVEAPMLDISASDIRRRLAMGRSIRFLVPEPVERYIAARGLYRQSHCCPPQP